MREGMRCDMMLQTFFAVNARISLSDKEAAVGDKTAAGV